MTGSDMTVRNGRAVPAHPELSLVMPCYNEEECIGDTAPDLAAAFREAGVAFELVLVDNGSTDRTGEIIDHLMEEGEPIRKVHLPVNRGYSGGILAGLGACTAPLIGYLCADGQVAPRDVVRTFNLMADREERVLAKVRRRFRQDSWKRKIVSIIYNGMMPVIFGWLGAIDINGSPKIFSRKNFQVMKLRSRDWFLDPEIILKAKGLHLRVIEIDVEGYARYGGASNVRPGTIIEFLKNIWRYRLGSYLRNWKRDVWAERDPAERKAPPVPARSGGARRGALPADRPVSLDAVRVLPQKRFEDERGWLHKVLTSSQCDGHPPAGEVYVTSALPGEVRGNHYHRRMGEWFAVVEGSGVLRIADPGSGARREIALDAASPTTVYVPPGIAHALVNEGDGPMISIAWAEREHDPEDVFPFDPAEPGTEAPDESNTTPAKA